MLVFSTETMRSQLWFFFPVGFHISFCKEVCVCVKEKVKWNKIKAEIWKEVIEGQGS